MSCKCRCLKSGGKGATGPIGATGATGPIGSGATGATGPRGSTGPSSIPNVGMTSYLTTTQLVENASINQFLRLGDFFIYINDLDVVDDTCTIVHNGLYLVIANVSWEANAVGERRISILINGGTTPFVQTVQANDIPMLPTYVSVSGIMYIGGGEVLQIGVYQDSGANLDILPGNSSVSIQLLHQYP